MYKALSLLVLALVFTMAACTSGSERASVATSSQNSHQLSANANPNVAPAQPDDPGTLALSGPLNNLITLDPKANFTVDNLRLIPILASDQFLADNRDLGNFQTLEQALEGKKVMISERKGSSANGGRSGRSRESNNRILGNQSPSVLNNEVQAELGYANVFGSDEATVNTLFAANHSNDTVMVMAGEVVKGGKQDRVIAQDFLLLPGEEKDISVFCVEHGRWDRSSGNGAGMGDNFAYAKSTASWNVRKAVTLEKEQSAVWDSVAVVTDNNACMTSTGAYTSMEHNKAYQNQRLKYIEHLKDLPKANNRTIGVVVISGDQVLGAELFGKPELFTSQYHTLLESYVSQAITSGKSPTIGSKEAAEYLASKLTLGAPATEETKEEEVQQLLHKGKVVHYATY